MSDPLRDADSYEPEDCARQYGEPSPDVFYALDALRVLTGPICETHWGSGPSDQDRFEASRACGRKL